MNAERRIKVGEVEVLIEGEGAETIVFMHGWPDTLHLWDAQAAHLSNRYRCVRFTLPGYEVGARRVHLTATDLVETLRAVVDAVSPDAPVTLMLHDWGCVHGYEFAMRYPGRVSRIIGVDIGNPRGLASGLTAAQKAMILGYQLILAGAWKVGGRVGDGLTRKMARLLGARGDPATIHSGMNYPYWNTWLGRGRKENKIQHFKPECPMLFIYGRRKPAMFHTKDWTDWLKSKRPENRVLEFDAGHWLMQRKPAEFNAAVDEWLVGAASAATGRG